MPKFEGCVEAKEISLTRKGANQHAHVLVRKHAAAPSGVDQPKPETVQMTDAEKAAAATQEAAVRKAALKMSTAIALMSDVTKGHFAGLDEDAQLAFLEKSREDQTKEAETAKAAADHKRVEEEAIKSGKTAKELELEKRFDDQAKELQALKADKVERDLEKRADTEFVGFPGGSKAVIPLLKSFAALPDAERTAAEDVLKSQARMATGLTRTLGGRTEEDVTKADAANARIEAGVTKYMAEHSGVSRGDAYEKVVEMAEFADDVAAIG